MHVFINLSKINFEVTLGVWHFATKLISALKSSSSLTLIGVMPEGKTLPEKYRNIFDETKYETEITNKNAGVELLLHHFQEPILNMPYVLIFFDLHIYDVQWKYGEVSAQLKAMEKLVQKSSAIVTNFPRTYFDLPKVIAGVPNSLFLSSSPTMREVINLPSGYSHSIIEKYGITSTCKILLYPAQLQAHKNHLTLFKAIKHLKCKIKDLKLICCGSSFKESHTEVLRCAIAELELEDSIILAGYVDDLELEALYERADVVISASLAEGGAYLAQEAIEKGKNVAVSSIRPARLHLKIMEANIALFDPLDITNIFETLYSTLTVVQNNDRARAIISKWTWKGLAAEYLSILNWVNDGSPSGYMPSMSDADIGMALAGDCQ